ncbi:MAG: hypothetical protein HKO54_11005 [Flavobacteriaceae bacterium]|nr:hypothetical protein [Flavobacteriaceae bacterium]
MTHVDKLKDADAIKDSVEHLERHGFENIKADIEGYETPKSYLKKDGDITITPDIVAERAGIKHYFEVSLKSEKPKLLKSKWRFLEVLSRMKNHRFKIITRRGHYKFTNEMLDDLNLKKDLIKL